MSSHLIRCQINNPSNHEMRIYLERSLASTRASGGMHEQMERVLEARDFLDLTHARRRGEVWREDDRADLGIDPSTLEGDFLGVLDK